MAKAKAVADDLASRLANENGKPLDDRVGEVVDTAVRRNAIGFHGRACIGQKRGKTRATSLVGRVPARGKETFGPRWVLTFVDRSWSESRFALPHLRHALRWLFSLSRIGMVPATNFCYGRRRQPTGPDP